MKFLEDWDREHFIHFETDPNSGSRIFFFNFKVLGFALMSVLVFKGCNCYQNIISLKEFAIHIRILGCSKRELFER